jgi:hypothetical protein
MGRPLGGGGAVVVAASGTASFVAIPAAAQEFWVFPSAAAFIDVRTNNTADTLDATDSQPLGVGLYGPFDLQQGYDRYIAVAGNGGASTVTITFAV